MPKELNHIELSRISDTLASEAIKQDTTTKTYFVVLARSYVVQTGILESRETLRYNGIALARNWRLAAEAIADARGHTKDKLYLSDIRTLRIDSGLVYTTYFTYAIQVLEA